MEAATCDTVMTVATPTTYFVNKLYNDQLQDVSESVNLVNAGAQVIQSPILCSDIRREVISVPEILLHKWNDASAVTTDLICVDQHHEGVSLAAGIFLVDKKIMDQFWSVGDEVFKVPAANEFRHASVFHKKKALKFENR